MAGMEALGRLFDVSIGYLNIDLNTSGATGKRVSLKNASGVSILCVVPATGGTEDLTFDVQQATAASGGSSADLDNTGVAGSRGIDHFYIKAATTLAGTETWTRVAQTEASEVVVSGTTYGASQCLVLIEVSASQLADGYSYISVNSPDPGSTARVCSVVYFLHDLAVQRRPANLVAALA
jgi:hypothetical protein